MTGNWASPALKAYCSCNYQHTKRCEAVASRCLHVLKWENEPWRQEPAYKCEREIAEGIPESRKRLTRNFGIESGSRTTARRKSIVCVAIVYAKPGCSSAFMVAPHVAMTPSKKTSVTGIEVGSIFLSCFRMSFRTSDLSRKQLTLHRTHVSDIGLNNL